MKKQVMKLAVMAALACPVMVQAASVDATVSAGLGYDTNVYRSPSSPYTDYSVTGNPVITPDEQSGFFIPLGLNATLNQKLAKSVMLKGEYDFEGTKYNGTKLENADEYDHLLRLGGEFTLKSTNLRSSHIYAGFRLQDHQQTYADRDTGEEKTTSVGAENISDQYSYTASGVELGYDYTKKQNWDLEIDYRQENRDYSTTPPNSSPQQDHTYTKLDATLGLDRGYSNVLLTYDYTDLGVTFKQNVSKALRMTYGYAITLRDDNYIGYNDYDMSEWTLGARYVMSKKMTIRGKFTAWQQDYPSAYNFDEPTQGYKSADGHTIEAWLDYARSKTQDLWLDIEFDANNNTDERYNYDRNMVMAGSSWKF
jgi:hypothetical protein